MERRVEVFFYGLFMEADALREKGFHPANARQASVEDMALHLGERATLVPVRGGRVHGMLMSLTHAEIDRLYAEPSVAAYRPEPVLASLRDGGIVAALCFNLPAVPAGVRSNPEYAAKLRIVARRMGLPETYVASI
jgi:Gamma-glutamyl cyclotransferase, AIG2-like